MIVYPSNSARVERHIEAFMVWMDEKDMDPSRHFFIKQNTHNTKVRIDQIRYRVDVNTLERSQVDHFKLNEIGRVVMTTVKPLYFDTYKKNRSTGSFVLIDPVTNNTVAVGMIIDKVSADNLPSRITDDQLDLIFKGKSLIKQKDYVKRYNQKAATIWITGLHGSGKNILAFQLEKQLFDLGATVVLVEGKNIRYGLSRELDFSPADRAEHLRRVAHMCKILNDQGIIAVCSFISPTESIRQQVGDIIGKRRFHQVYIDCSIEYARKTDKYGLYKLADEGKLENMPGIDTEFDVPEKPALVLTPEKDGKVEKVIEYLESKKIFPIE